MDAVPEDWERALAIVAHPDDLEYGGSTAVAKWTGQGKTVVEVLATRGEAGIDGMDPEEAGRVRAAEQVEAARRVGVDTVEFLGLPDGMLEYGLPLRRALTAAIRRHRPEVVVSLNFRESFPDGGFNMADHRVLGLAVADAVRDAGNRWVFRDLGLEPWPGVRFALFGSSPRSTHYVDVSGHLQDGIDSLLAHKEYYANLGAGFDAAAFLTGMMEPAGRALGVEHAMVFEMIET
ncbi:MULTISPECIES: PIG-L deacetylase family protein [Actinomadura]|uniref:PIG-L family deacetylase n=1 Tax=Actinomadura litoris TaxID=2678616 RepID=A0A7K1KV77_9ACTN|nr:MULTISPECIES: PIG-L deacetylase family protein [Actinomadura]MBT2211164.1 PIG-L family deacetylase [Actinomadura sp. NEAU-AAG7]MUN36082.1 PIG-L family deacetylase [Actinomadura litoris]